tara:strand:+ start:3365 stop:3529 length:165 start_codon:yes stop_codon:yes gene_type:complete
MSEQRKYREKTFGLSNYRKAIKRKERNRRLLGLVVGLLCIIGAGYLFFNGGINV